MGQREEWDSFYRSNGRAWRGSCRLPDPLGGRGRALDIGCGSGKSASALIEMGYSVTGMELSDEAVAICRGRFGPSAEFVQGDVRSMPFGDSEFGYAVAVHVLEHLDDGDVRRASAEISRVLVPGARLFVRDFAPGDLREGSRESSDIVYVHRTPDDIAALMPEFSAESSELAEERTRFGAVRRRSELLLVNRKQ